MNVIVEHQGQVQLQLGMQETADKLYPTISTIWRLSIYMQCYGYIYKYIVFATFVCTFLYLQSQFMTRHLHYHAILYGQSNCYWDCVLDTMPYTFKCQEKEMLSFIVTVGLSHLLYRTVKGQFINQLKT